MPNLSEHQFCADLDPIPVLVKKEYLENFEFGHYEFVSGTLQALWAYPGHQPTFTVLLEDGTVFSYLPASAFTAHGESRSLAPEEACSVHAPSSRFVVYRMPFLSSNKILCYSKNREYLGVGRYHFSMEWPYENEVVHFVCVDDGPFCFVPNHKMLVFPALPEVVPSLPSWEKLRKEWTK